MSVFVGVGVLYLQGLIGATPIPPSLEGQFMWGLAVMLLALAGILSAFKVGEISALIISGSGATGSGLMGMAMMVATGWILIVRLNQKSKVGSMTTEIVPA